MRQMFRKFYGTAILAAGLLLGGAAVQAADTPVTFQLNWMAGGPNAGFASALAQGYYKQAGLDVTLVQGNGSGNTAQMVAAGRAQLAYADAVAVMQLIAKGAPMRVVERDVIAHMGFRPAIAADLRTMDARIFDPRLMGLAKEVTAKPQRHRSPRVAQWHEARRSARGGSP